MANDAPDEKAAIDHYLQLEHKKYKQRLGIVPGTEQFQYQERQDAYFEVSGIALPARTWARSIDGQHFKIDVYNPQNLPPSETKRIKKDCLKVLKKFGVAERAPDRKTADQHGLDVLWKDWKRRRKEWSYSPEESHLFRIGLWRKEGNRRAMECDIEDLRLALSRYCDRYWNVPVPKNISQPGRPKALLKVNGAKIRIGMANAVQRQGWRKEVRQWMSKHHQEISRRMKKEQISRTAAAARTLGVGPDILQNIMSSITECRFAEETLIEVLDKIEVLRKWPKN